MTETIHCDIAIVGGGSAGLSLAGGSASLGASVILVEADKMGGDCLNSGCVPSKALIAAAKQNLSFTEAMEHVHSVISKIAPHDSVERFESLGVNVIKAQAEFISKDALRAGTHTIKAKYFVVATGSSPFIPPIPGLADTPYETNETIFNLKKRPKHLLIIGGGPIGCELAQAFRGLGSEVTILEALDILPHDDKECVEVIRSTLIDSGITIHEQSVVKKVKTCGRKIGVTIEQKGQRIQVTGNTLLVAAGRKANTHGLNLGKAGVNFERGISADKRLRTSNKKIYAIGDVVGPYQFTHTASYQAGIVLKNILFKLPAKVNYESIPWVTYTTPELAHAGITASDAASKNTQTISFAFEDNDRAQAEGSPIGKIKVIVTSKGKILGVTIVGKNAGELILPWVIAIRAHKTLRIFADTIIPYPTLSEISKQVAGEFYKPKLFSKGVRRLVKFLL